VPSSARADRRNGLFGDVKSSAQYSGRVGLAGFCPCAPFAFYIFFFFDFSLVFCVWGGVCRVSTNYGID